MRILLPAVFLAVALGSARATLPPADVPYVIITSSGLATAFEPLAAFKTSLGLPTRWVTSTFYPTNGTTSIPADLYDAGLDGYRDGDGDGILGEPWVSAEDPGDAADLQPELALGRAPVTSAEEAALFVRKNLDFQILSGLPAPARALLEGEVVLPENYGPTANYVVLDGALHSEAIRSTLEGAPRRLRRRRSGRRWLPRLPNSWPTRTATMSNVGPT